MQTMEEVNIYFMLINSLTVLPAYSVGSWYRLLIMVSGDFSQTRH